MPANTTINKIERQNNVDNTITTLEFCAGYGGIGLGIKNIFGERMLTIAYCELEGYAQANLISKMEKGLMDVAPIWNDLKTFPYESFHGLVDILIAGYPCQPFSAAGKRAGKEDPRHLWPWIADGIRLLQPRMCFFENVEGHISLGLSTVISDLEELGYKVSFGIFSASEVGAVHQRKRVFIMAHRSDERLQGGKWFWQARAQGASSGHATECSSYSWPSRPGQPQHAWEPPRVVGNTKHDGLIAKQIIRSDEETSNDWWAKEQESAGESTRANRSIDVPSIQGCSSGSKQLADTNSSEQGSQRGNNGEVLEVSSEQRTDQCAALSGGEGCEKQSVGNSKCFRLESTGYDGAMEKEGSSSSGERSESSYATKKSSNSSISVSEIKPKMGRDIDGATYGVDISKLSSLCDSELAEIYEWMVKGDNRTDELRSCGNGVVPATAERAFRVLMQELINK